jgi:hypothetical protein
MKAMLLSVVLAIVLTRSLSAQTTQKEWERKAVSDYPDMGIRDSKFNKRFLELVAQRGKDNTAFFKDPRWPLVLADEIGIGQPELVETHPVLIVREFRVPTGFFEEPEETAQAPAAKPPEGMEFLKLTRGVAFRGNRFAMYSPVSSTLVIKDTPETIEMVRKLIEQYRRTGVRPSRLP